MFYISDAHQDIAHAVLKNKRFDFHLPITEIRVKERQPSLLSLFEYKQANVKIIFSTLYHHPKEKDYSKQILKQLDLYKKFFDRYKELQHIKDIDSLYKVLKDPYKIGLVFLMEGAYDIKTEKDFYFYLLKGVKIISFTWNYANQLGGGTSEPGGITSLGKYILSLMQKNKVIIDISHASDELVKDIFLNYDSVVIASHSNVRKLTNHKRNLTDSQIKEVISRQGVIGINFYNDFIKTKEKPDIYDIFYHIDYINNIAGNSLHVGFGTDFDGGISADEIPDGINRITDIHKLIDIMYQKGYKTSDIINIFYLNWIRFLEKIL